MLLMIMMKLSVLNSFCMSLNICQFSIKTLFLFFSIKISLTYTERVRCVRDIVRLGAPNACLGHQLMRLHPFFHEVAEYR